MSYLIGIKPLSVNKCWQGRRYKTDDYKEYEKAMLKILPKKIFIPKGKIWLKIKVCISSKNADIDNILKPTIDILQKKYGFNDRKIYRLSVIKEDVKKGFESIEFQFYDA